MASVRLEGVRKRFGSVEIVHGVDLDIADGEFVVFVGPSGCGKSTLLRLIAGLEDISAGDLLIGEKRVNALPPKERGIAMVFQSYALYPHMSVYENMAFGLELARSSKAEIDAAVRRAADILELTPLLDRLPKQLSGGQRQRVAIGRAIVREPKVFLFDEPLSNLDAALRVQMRIEIAKLHESMGVTMIYVTHDQVEAMTLADKIVVLNAGRIEQVGAPLALYHHPENLFVAGFIGSPKMNVVETRVAEVSPEGVAVDLPGGGRVVARVDPTRAAAGAPASLGIRPEHLTLGPGEATLTGRVEVVEQLGEAYLLHVRLPDRTLITAKLPGDSHLRAGAEVALGVDGALCHLFDADGKALRRQASAGANAAAAPTLTAS
ncbi:ABC transporter ATP-binding protein [Salinarimonas sp.]|uniref:ABC transporter ATP-binding protein n=1 Tax=Salinarimonas sp. TaxID=2766526 RepID=UPI00391A4468